MTLSCELPFARACRVWIRNLEQDDDPREQKSKDDSFFRAMPFHRYSWEIHLHLLPGSRPNYLVNDVAHDHLGVVSCVLPAPALGEEEALRRQMQLQMLSCPARSLQLPGGSFSEKYDILEFLGSGPFGGVFKTSLRAVPWKVRAVKIGRECASEMEILSRLHHPRPGVQHTVPSRHILRRWELCALLVYTLGSGWAMQTSSWDRAPLHKWASIGAQAGK